MSDWFVFIVVSFDANDIPHCFIEDVLVIVDMADAVLLVVFYFFVV